MGYCLTDLNQYVLLLLGFLRVRLGESEQIAASRGQVLDVPLQMMVAASLGRFRSILLEVLGVLGAARHVCGCPEQLGN